MSLNVSTGLLERAQAGEVSNADFVACVRDSLPYAWGVVGRLVDEAACDPAGRAFNQETPGTDAEWGQLFRLFASDAIRGAVERHFDVKLAFQNCHRAAVFPSVDDPAYAQFISPVAQILNQSPELLNC